MLRLQHASWRKYAIWLVLFFLAVTLAIAYPKIPKIASKVSKIADKVAIAIEFSLTPKKAVSNGDNLVAKPLPIVRSASIASPLRVNPNNPRYFTDGSGKAIYLTGSHTWSNLQDNGLTDPPPAFNYKEYLDFLVANNHNFFRLWVWEQAKWMSETSKDYWIAPLPYARLGKEMALDNKPKFDLTKFDPVYFERLRQRVLEAKQRGIYVSIMLFSGWCLEDKSTGDAPTTQGNPWRGHPYNRLNNVNYIDGDRNNNNKGEETHSLQIPAITALQEAYARKVIDTVNDLDNVLYEISNESNPGSQDWQYHLINSIKSYEAKKPKQHPVGMTVEFPNGNNSVLFASPADWISPNGDVRNRPVADGKKVIVADTDHLCGICGDRQWVWESFTRGENPLFMDVYDGAVVLSAPPDAPDPLHHKPLVDIRRNLGYALTYANRMNLAAMKPHPELTSTRYCLANPASGGSEYLVYAPEGGEFVVNLSAAKGDLLAEWFNPNTGEKITGIKTTGGGNRGFTVPFDQDAVLYIKGNAT
jgi:hypothetical protein